MTYQRMLDLLRTQPFRPLRVFTDDGSGVYQIPQPNSCLPLANEVLVGRPDSLTECGAYDRFVIVPYSHIARIEPADLPAATA